MLGQTSISRWQGPQTPTYSKSEVMIKDPYEAKTKHYKYPNQVEHDLKTIPPAPTSTTKTCFFNSGDHSFSSMLEMRALKHACSNNKLKTEQQRQV